MELVRDGGHEREPAQLEAVLEDLGPPPSEDPLECALWVVALVNPLPALGVAKELRPAILAAACSEVRACIGSHIKCKTFASAYIWSQRWFAFEG
jgi:hypothetical protein